MNSDIFRKWFQFRFPEDISFENYETIDHVIPLAAFELTDET